MIGMSSQQSQYLIDEVEKIIRVTNHLTEKISNLHLNSPDNSNKHDLIMRKELTDKLCDILREHDIRARDIAKEYWAQNLYEQYLANQKIFVFIASELPDYIDSAENLLDQWAKQMYEEYVKFGFGSSSGDNHPLAKEVWAFLGDPIEHDFYIEILHHTITLLAEFYDVAHQFENDAMHNLQL